MLLSFLFLAAKIQKNYNVECIIDNNLLKVAKKRAGSYAAPRSVFSTPYIYYIGRP